MNSDGLEMFNKVMHQHANSKVPLHEFCIDNGIYYFACHSLAQDLEINEKFYEDQSLTKEYLIACWSKQNGQEYYERMLRNDKNSNGLLSKRFSSVNDLIDAHFNKKYSLAIPAAFTIIEGIFREYGQVSFDKSDKPNYRMNEEQIKGKMLYSDEDSIKYFTKFLNKIMSGKAGKDEFHRNTVMHGVNTQFATKENSLILLMSIFEFSRIYPNDFKMQDKVI